MAKFCIDPGHGGSDPGAVNGNRREKDDVLRLAQKIRPLLEGQGHTVLLTREDDRDVTILERCAAANRAGCDYFLSLHRNSGAGTAQGSEIWVHSRAAAQTMEKAEGILSRCCGAAGKNRGVKKGAVSYPDYGVNTGTEMPSALLELLFVSNEQDNRLFDENLERYAAAIAKGLAAAVGAPWQDKPGLLYRVQLGAFAQRENAERLARELEAKGYSAFIREEIQ